MGCDDAYMDFVNKYATAEKMKSLLADEKVSGQIALEAAAAARAACLRSKFLCRIRRDQLLQTLDSPTPDLTPGDREARQQECDELAKRLDELDAAYPGELENDPQPTKSTATRSMR